MIELQTGVCSPLSGIGARAPFFMFTKSNSSRKREHMSPKNQETKQYPPYKGFCVNQGVN